MWAWDLLREWACWCTRYVKLLFNVNNMKVPCNGTTGVFGVKKIFSTSDWLDFGNLRKVPLMNVKWTRKFWIKAVAFRNYSNESTVLRYSPQGILWGDVPLGQKKNRKHLWSELASTCSSSEFFMLYVPLDDYFALVFLYFWGVLTRLDY